MLYVTANPETPLSFCNVMKILKTRVSQILNLAINNLMKNRSF